MKKIAVLSSLMAFIAAAVWAGEGIRPISNPVFFDSPDVGMQVHPVFMHHKLPSTINTELGDVPVGGDVQLYALQFEIPFTEDLSLIAVKDGYVVVNPDETLSEEEGFADLAAGLKYVFHRGEGMVASARLVAELPTGNDDVFQGNGKGTLNPAVSGMTIKDGVQFAGTIGYIQALDDEDSSLFYNSWHVSYALTEKLFPLLELNHFHVVDAGDGGQRFDSHVEGGVPAVARWEGGDLINLGASHGDDEADFVSLAAGLRVRLNETVDLGAAYEFPLTDEENSLMDSRITLDLVWNL